jgi:hypothetical protein
MCLLLDTNWVFISPKTALFIVAAVNTSNLTELAVIELQIEIDQFCNEKCTKLLMLEKGSAR